MRRGSSLGIMYDRAEDFESGRRGGSPPFLLAERIKNCRYFSGLQQISDL